MKCCFLNIFYDFDYFLLIGSLIQNISKINYFEKIPFSKKFNCVNYTLTENLDDNLNYFFYIQFEIMPT